MVSVVLILAILILILWKRTQQNASRVRALEDHIDLLERKLSDLIRSVKDLRHQSGTTQETVPPEKVVLTPKPPAPETAAPAATPPAAVPKRPVPPAPPAVAPVPQAPRTPLPRPVTESSPIWKLPHFDWESLVGVKLFSWIAGVALLLGVVLFLGYAKNQGWILPQVRMAIGLIAGIGLLALCEAKAARKYPVTANAMDASAIAILFSTFYAARAVWDLIGAIPAFLFMVLIAGLAVLLSIRRNSAFIALLGLLGGFATPALLSTGENQPISLFSYLLLLNAGLAYVATQKRWPLLTTLSMVLTFVYQWGWVVKFLSESQLPTALGIFLVFPVLTFVMISLGYRHEGGKTWLSLYGQTANITALLPLLFTLYLASVPAYGHRYILLFGFLFILDAGLFAVAVARGPEILHTVGGISTIVVTAIWLRSSYETDAWPAILAFILLFSYFYLSAPFIARRFKRAFSAEANWAAYTAPLLLFAIPVLAVIEPACAAPGPLFATLFAILAGAAGFAIYQEKGPIYFAAALFAILAEAVWAHKYLTPERLVGGLAVFGVFGLLYIAVPIAAQRWRKSLQPGWAGSALILASLALLTFLAAGKIASSSIWGLAMLMFVLNLGLFRQGAASGRPWFAIAGTGLSWIILAILWISLPLEDFVIPALSLTAGFALMVLGGNVWLQRQMPESALPRNGMLLCLAGYLFLAFIASDSAYSIPPWPFFCVLLILNLAIGSSALYLRRTDLYNMGMASSALLTMIWVAEAEIEPWPQIAIYAAGVLSLLGLAWLYLARKFERDTSGFSKTAAMTVLACQIVAITAGSQAGAPGVGFLLGAHLFFLVVLLGLAWIGPFYEYAVYGVLPASLAVSLWQIQHSGSEYWPQVLLFSIPVFLVFIIYPLVLGRRSGRSLSPFLAAVIASVPFFFQAREAILHAGWKEFIGILPLSQALLLGLLVLKLLKIEPPEKRSLGRLALVAGAALAFITVAVPLQLDREWITLGWALEAAALSWLYRKVPHTGLLYAATGLFAAVFIRLAFNPFVLTYEPRSAIRVWNWYLYTYLIASAAMIAGGRILSKTRDELLPGFPRMSKLIPAGGIALLFLLMNIEIADFFSTGPTITFKFSATLAQDLTYTLGWAVFALALLALGIVIRNQPARIASIVLLAATIVKCFVHDLARLGELYRVASFVGLGICLALVALALQKFVFNAAKTEKQN